MSAHAEEILARLSAQRCTGCGEPAVHGATVCLACVREGADDMPGVEDKTCNLVAAFEGAGGYANVSGNFDGQGVSFGFLQWNLGRGTLQPLLRHMAEAEPALFRAACTVHVPQYGKDTDLSANLLEVCAMTPKLAVAWAQERQDAGGRFRPEYRHWVELFRRLGNDPVLQGHQRKAAKSYLSRAWADMQLLGYASERGFCLLFDVAVQNGGLRPAHRRAYAAAGGPLASGEPARMKHLAHAVARCAIPRWQRDVLSRKLCIATGMGIVHGRSYHLERDYDITLRAAR